MATPPSPPPCVRPELPTDGSTGQEPPTSGGLANPETATQQLPKRKRRSEAEIAADKLIKDQRRQAREKEKEDRAQAKKAKELEKAVKKQLAKDKEKEKTSRFFWTEGATADLLELLNTLKSEHEIAEEASPGFLSWTKYFKDHLHRKSTFDSLKEIPHNTLERRYKALLTTYRAVRDSCAATGGEGFHAMLTKYNLTEHIYGRIGELHEHNAALNCVGGANPATLTDDDAGARVSVGSRGEDSDDGEGDESFIPRSPSSSSGGSHPAGDEEARDDCGSHVPSGHRAFEAITTQAKRVKATPEVTSSTSATPLWPPPRSATGSRNGRSDRARATKSAAEAAGKAEDAIDGGMSFMMIFQKEAADRAERKAECEARREEREAKRDKLRQAREDERLKEIEERREVDKTEREARRRADLERYERDEERRAAERERDLEARAQDRQAAQMMNMMFMRFMGQMASNGSSGGNDQDGSGGAK